MPGNQRLTDWYSVDMDVQHTASGGFGVVFMGPDRLDDNQWRALKTIRPDLMQRSPHVRERFIDEALIWCGLWAHTNLLSAGTVTEINGQPFLVLEYAARGSLRNWLRNGLPFNIGLEWAQHIAAGLVALHSPDPTFLRHQPIVHRDLKPENILIDQFDNAMITDFGLSKILDEEEAPMGDVDEGDDPDAVAVIAGTHPLRIRTQRGAVMGTPAYMAPEQWLDPASVGPHTDIYAFGLILYELLTGCHPLGDPFRQGAAKTWHDAHLYHAPRTLIQASQDLPKTIEDLYQASVTKDFTQRPTAAEALSLLQTAAESLGYTPYEVLQVPRTRDNMATRWRTWAVAYERFGIIPEALERINRARALAPQNPSVLLLYGNLLAKMGQLDAALQAYDTALAAFSVNDPHRRPMRNSGL